jgi:hypothetical protein
MEEQTPVMGRPRKEIDWNLLDSLITLSAQLNFCAERQLVEWKEEVNHQTIKACREVLERRIKERFNLTFTEYREQKKEPLRLKLRQKQIDMALAGNVALLIWLGKNELGQKDKQEISTEDDKPITLAYLPLSQRETA